MARQTIKTQCSSCSGTGVYCGFAEPQGTGVVCLGCSGTGCAKMTYEPFTERKRRLGVKEVRLSSGSLIATGVGPRGTSVSYEDFWNGKMPKAQ